jgi:hypothetical protein
VIYALAVIAVLLLLALVAAAVTGRARVRSCCATADPAKDLRMRAAFEDAGNSPTPKGRSTLGAAADLVRMDHNRHGIGENRG